jgi:hypothetical protein
MARQIARGFFRLWLVTSILWMVAIGIVTWKKLPVDDWTRDTECARKTIDECVRDYAAKHPGEFNPNEYLHDATVREQREAIWVGAFVALLPPMLVLLLGAALAWAFSGFRAKPLNK